MASTVTKIRMFKLDNPRTQQEISVDPMDRTNLCQWVHRNYPGWALQHAE